MQNVRHRTTLLTTLLLLALIPNALAQDTGEWEYLVVSYGETYFSNPLLNAGSENATYSKVQLFSDIGVTIPNEAISLQRNIDILGMFEWEMVTVIGAIGGDQQIVFKRPYDAERSAAEAERIRTEREELIAAYNTSKNTTSDDSDTSEASAPEESKPEIVDVDAVERAQATDARNQRDEATVRRIIETAAASGFSISDLTINGMATGPTSDPDVTIRLKQDVTDAALIAPGQYRKSLVDDAVAKFTAALVGSGFVEAEYSFCGIGRNEPDGKAGLTITAVIQHDGITTNVGSYWQTHCFNP